MKTWHQTISGTRIYCEENSKQAANWALRSTRLGHVRNKGPRQWHVELYKTGESATLDSLQGGKAWVETAEQLV